MEGKNLPLGEKQSLVTYLIQKLNVQHFLMRMFCPISMKASGDGPKIAGNLLNNFIQKEEGQYDLSQSLESLDKNLQSIVDANSHQSAGSLLNEEKILSPTDAQSIKFNLERLEALDKKANTLEGSVKIEDNKLFVKSGKIRTGEECAHKFNEEYLSSLVKIKSDISKTLVKLRDIDLKHRRMYPTKSSFVSKKRRQKENRADVSDINFNNLPKVSKKDARWLKILVQQKKFTNDACLKMNSFLLPSVLKVINNQEEKDEDTDHDETEEEDTCVLDIVDYEI